MTNTTTEISEKEKEIQLNLNRSKMIIDSTTLTNKEKDKLLRDYYSQPIPLSIFFGIAAGGALIAFGLFLLKTPKFKV